MAKTAEKNAELKVDSAESEQIILEGGEIVTKEELLKQLKSKTAGMDITSEYMEFEDGKPVRAIKIRETTIKTTRKGETVTVPAVRLILEDGKQVITAAQVVVSSLQDYPNGSSFIIEKTGKAKGPNGDYFTFKINELL